MVFPLSSVESRFQKATAKKACFAHRSRNLFFKFRPRSSRAVIGPRPAPANHSRRSWNLFCRRGLPGVRHPSDAKRDRKTRRDYSSSRFSFFFFQRPFHKIGSIHSENTCRSRFLEPKMHAGKEKHPIILFCHSEFKFFQHYNSEQSQNLLEYHG